MNLGLSLHYYKMVVFNGIKSSQVGALHYEIPLKVDGFCFFYHGKQPNTNNVTILLLSET